jgi:hypothetical protein
MQEKITMYSFQMIKCSLSCNPLVITKKVISKWKAIECIEQLVDGQCCSGSALFTHQILIV